MPNDKSLGFATSSFQPYGNRNPRKRPRVPRCISLTRQVRISFLFSFETGEIDYVAHAYGTEPQKWTTEVRDVASSLTEGQSPAFSFHSLTERSTLSLNSVPQTRSSAA